MPLSLILTDPSFKRTSADDDDGGVDDEDDDDNDDKDDDDSDENDIFDVATGSDFALGVTAATTLTSELSFTAREDCVEVVCELASFVENARFEPPEVEYRAFSVEEEEEGKEER